MSSSFTYLMMMSYLSIWAPRCLPCKIPPLPTTMHLLHLSGPEGGPWLGRTLRVCASVSSVPSKPRGGGISQTPVSLCRNTGIWSRLLNLCTFCSCTLVQPLLHGLDNNSAELFTRAWERASIMSSFTSSNDWTLKLHAANTHREQVIRRKYLKWPVWLK